MRRGLLALNAILLACLCLLWTIDASTQKKSDARLAADSQLHPLAGEGTIAVDQVRGLQISLPPSGSKWIYERREDGWHLPQFRNGFGLTQEIEGFLRSILEGRGTIAGRKSSDAKRFGLVEGEAMEAEIADGQGHLRLRAMFGSVAPGQRSSECFAAAAESDSILHLNSNPRAFIAPVTPDQLPPLLDRRVIPLALARGMPLKVTLAGEGTQGIPALIRRDIPKEQLADRRPDRGPSFEWYGVFKDGEKVLNEMAVASYISALSDLLFDELLGQRSGLSLDGWQASLTVTLEYEGGTTDLLSLGSQPVQGLRLIHHSATDQVFLISEKKAQGLIPDVEAFLRPSPDEGSSSTSTPAGGLTTLPNATGSVR